MKVCPACTRRSPPDADFCECGEYLGWVPVEATTQLGTGTTVVRSTPQIAAGPPGVAGPAEVPHDTRGPGTPAGPPGGPGPAEIPQDAGRPPLTVLLGIYSSRGDAGAGVRAETTVAAGGVGRLFALIRNQSGIVDNYDLWLDGFPADWWTVRPPTVYLVPLGRGEGFEQELEIVLHPPRAPVAEARAWTIHLIATSRSSGQEVAAAGATVTIEPYRELDLTVLPPLADGRLGARFEAVVENRANAPAEVAVWVTDDEQNLTFEPDGRVVTLRALRRAASPFSGRLRKRATQMAGRVRTPAPSGSGAPLPRAGERLVSKTLTDQRRRATAKADDAMASAAGENSIDPELGSSVAVIAPGDSTRVRFVARPQTQLWIGRRTNRRFAVNAAEVGADARPTVAPGTLRQGPWLPTWATLVIALLVIAITLLLLLRPKEVAVPDVQGKSVAAAEQILQGAGLVLAPDVQTAVDPSTAPGLVARQTPQPPDRVRKGTAVSITVATSIAEGTVPSVHGETLAEADDKLTAAGFTLGSASPKPDPKQIVSSQIPTAGSRRPKGTPVNVFLVPRPTKPKTGATGTTGATGKAGAAAAGAAAAGAPVGGMVAVPAFAGSQLAAYQAKLAHDELAATETYRIDPSPAGTVLATVPKPATKVKTHSSVEIAVSAGFPLLTYDTSANLEAVAGASGASSTAVAIDGATEPAWDIEGRDLAFVRGPSIFVRPGGQASDTLVPLTPDTPGTSYDNPAFAPTHRGEIVASVSHTAAADSLCFSQIVDGTASTPSCLVVPGWQLGSITWGRSGYSLLVAATASDDSTTFGLLQFFSATRFAGQASSWETSGTLVTPSSPGHGVLQAAISPDGKQLAAISNLGGGSFHVVLTTVRDLGLKAATTLPTVGCDVAWRSDGGELAVVEGDPECATAVGPIVGLAPATPQTTTTLVLEGENPAWQPVEVDRGG